jgi:hypothetical protein
MDHLMRFDELCLKLAAAGEIIRDDEKLVVLLGSLPQEYDAMVRIIEATTGATLLSAKEMLRREYETLQKREKKEMAFKVATQYGGGGSRRNPRGREFMKKEVFFCVRTLATSKLTVHRRRRRATSLCSRRQTTALAVTM